MLIVVGDDKMGTGYNHRIRPQLDSMALVKRCGVAHCDSHYPQVPTHELQLCKKLCAKKHIMGTEAVLAIAKWFPLALSPMLSTRLFRS
jgi:hypothetical protein